jgi:hypothetical protein
MKVIQSGTFQELKVSSSASSANIKVALMRTTTGKEEPELPLRKRISS